MFEYISLKGFQKYRDPLILELDERITTLCGSSDEGKSSVLRGLHWLAFNRPSGNGFINNLSPLARVELGVDGHKVVRKKGEGGNYYFLDGKKYVSFGNGVPEGITHILNLSEDYYQSQHSPSYWVGLSAGKVSQELNKIVDLGLIDQTLFNLSSELRKAKTVVEITEKRLKDSQARRRELEWVEEANEKLTQLETRQQELMEEDRRLKILTGLVSRLEQLEPQLTSGVPPERIARIDELMSETEKITQQRDKLSKILQQMEQLELEKCHLEKELRGAGEQLQELSQGKCPLCGKPMPKS